MAGAQKVTSNKEVSPPESADVEAAHQPYYEDEEEFVDDPFDIAHTKNAPHESLRRWRV